jgi:SNF2 family DNA or RNA helicase
MSLSTKEYIFIINVKDKVISVKNPKYLKNARTQKFISHKITKNFYDYPDLITAQSYKVYDELKKADSISFKTTREIKSHFVQNLPLWILEYKEIWNLIKDNLYIQYLPTSTPVPATLERINLYFKDLKINSKTNNIQGKIKKIIIKLNTFEKIEESFKKNLPFEVTFVTYKYQNFSSDYGLFGLGVLNDGYLINDEYKKILKPDPELKKLREYFFLNEKYLNSISNPASISQDNLIKLFKKYKDDLIVLYGADGKTKIKFIESKILIENLYSYDSKFLEKLIYSIQQNEKLFKYQNNLYFIDDDLKNKIDTIIERFLSADLKEFLNKIKIGDNFKKKDEKVINKLNELKDYKAQPFPHQEIAISWMYNLYKHNIPGCILADDMGLGKSLSTISTLALIQHEYPNKKITIISPASMVGTWESEIKKFYPTLKNYKILSYEKALRSINNTDILILDEAQKIKNHKAETYKAISSIKKEFTIILTGTPIENKIDDIINILGVINPVFLKLKSLKKFSSDFVIKLKTVINPIFLQRKKEDVNITELNVKLIEKPIFIEPSKIEKLLLEKIREIYHNKLIQLNATSNYEFYESQILLTGVLRIRQAISYPKQLPEDLKKLLPKNLQIAINTLIPNKYKKLEQLCIEKVNKKEKIVIFAEFTDTIKFLKENLSKKFKVITLTGSDSSERRKIIIDSFQNNQFDIIIISLKAGNSGITLHSANNVIIYDLWFNPQVLAQAVARVHRIGQTKDVEADFLVLKDTFDERIYNIIYAKKKLIQNFEQYNPNKITKEIADDYFKSFKKKI